MSNLQARTKKQNTKLLSLSQTRNTHTCTHTQTRLEMMNAQACLIEKTRTHACTSSFSVIPECTSMPVWIHKRECVRTHTRIHWACCVIILKSSARRPALYMQNANTTNVAYHIPTDSVALWNRRCLSTPCDAHNTADETMLSPWCLSALWCFACGLNAGNVRVVLHAMPSTHMPGHMPMSHMDPINPCTFSCC